MKCYKSELTYGPDSALRLAQRSSERASLDLNIWILYRETHDGSQAENMDSARQKGALRMSYKIKKGNGGSDLRNIRT